MTGADYVAVVRLSNQADETLAQPGETCERVAAESLGWLAEQGLIVPTDAAGEGAAPEPPRVPADGE